MTECLKLSRAPRIPEICNHKVSGNVKVADVICGKKTAGHRANGAKDGLCYICWAAEVKWAGVTPSCLLLRRFLLAPMWWAEWDRECLAKEKGGQVLPGQHHRVSVGRREEFAL